MPEGDLKFIRHRLRKGRGRDGKQEGRGGEGEGRKVYKRKKISHQHWAQGQRREGTF